MRQMATLVDVAQAPVSISYFLIDSRERFCGMSLRSVTTTFVDLVHVHAPARKVEVRREEKSATGTVICECDRFFRRVRVIRRELDFVSAIRHIEQHHRVVDPQARKTN